jgi:hypothetical protein
MEAIPQSVETEIRSGGTTVNRFCSQPAIFSAPSTRSSSMSTTPTPTPRSLSEGQPLRFATSANS